MKSLLKRTLSVLMIVLVILTSAPLSGFVGMDWSWLELEAEANNEGVSETEIDSDLVSANSIGQILVDAIEDNNQYNDETMNGIYFVDFDGNVFDVEFNVNQNANVVLGVYEDGTNKMVHSQTQKVESVDTNIYFEVDLESLPKFFLVKVFLLAEDYTALSQPFVYNDFTERYQEFLNKTVDDFDEECVVSFDEDDENFAVLLEDNIFVESSETENTIVDYDENEGIYIILNPSEEVINADIGDVIYLRSNYESDDIVIKIKEKNTYDNKICIVADNLEIKDVFSYVKIDATASPEKNDFKDNDNVTQIDPPVVFAARNVESNQEKYTKFQIPLFESTDFVSGDATLGLKTNLIFRYDVELFGVDTIEISLKTDLEFTVGITISGEINFSDLLNINFFEIEMPILPGVVNFKLSLQPVIKGKINLEFSVGITGSFGFIHKDDKTTPIKTWTKDTDLSPEIEGEIFIGFELSCGFELIEICDIEVATNVGLKFEMELEDENDTIDFIHECDFCIKGEKSFVISFSFKVTLGTDFIKKKFVLIDESSREFKIFLEDFYVSNVKGIGKGICPNKQYSVVFKVYNSREDRTFPSDVRVNFVNVGLVTERTYYSVGLHKITIYYKGEIVGHEIINVPDEATTIVLYLDDYYVEDENDYDDDDDDDDDDINDGYNDDDLENDKENENNPDDNIPDEEKEYAENQCGPKAFWQLTSTGELIISGSGEVDREDKFYDLEINTVTIGKNITNMRFSNIICERFYVETDSQFYSVDNYGAIYNKDKTILYRFPSNSLVTTYNAPNSLICIEDFAFYQNNKILSINLPDSTIDVSKWAVYKSAWMQKQLDKTETDGSVIYLGKVAIDLDNFDSVSGYEYNDWCFKEIKIKDGTLAIGESAFAWYEGIEKILIPNSVVFVGATAFDECLVKTAGPIGSNADLEFGWQTYFPNYAFSGLRSLERVVFPSGLKKIGAYAFEDCGLKSITIPNSVTEIGERIFSGMTDLSTLILPEGLKELGDLGLWSSRDKLEYIYIPGSVESFAVNFLLHTEKIKTAGPIGGGFNIEFGWNTEIPDYAFIGSCIKSIELPNGLKKIGSYAFKDCVKLTNIQLCEGLETIGSCAFENCDSFEYIKLPMSVIDIGSSVFADCENLISAGPYDSGSTIEFGWDAKIPDHAFQGSSIKSIVLPKDLKIIGSDAFSYCVKLTNIQLFEGLETIGSYAFENCDSLEYIKLPKSLVDINSCAFLDCQKLITAGPYESGSNIEYCWDKKIPNCAFYGASINEVIISDNITEIGQFAFSRSKIRSLELHENISTIESYTFENCEELTSIVFPQKMKMIADNAFASCVKLKDIDFPVVIDLIGSRAFYNCTNLKSLILPERCEKIESFAFDKCSNLEKVILPEICNGVEAFAFYDCSNLHTMIVPEYCEISQIYDYKSLEKIVVHSKSFSVYFPENSLVSIYGYEGSEMQKRAEIDGLNFYDVNTCEHYITKMFEEYSGDCYNYGCAAGIRCLDCGVWLHGHNLILPPHNDLNNDKWCDLCQNRTDVYATGTFGENIEWTLSYNGTINIFGTGKMGEYTCDYINKDLDFVYPLKFKVFVGEGILSVSSDMFYLTNSAEEIVLPDSLLEIKSGAIYSTLISKINIPKNVETIEEGAILGCKNLMEISVDSNNQYYKSIDGVLYSIDQRIILAYPSGKLDDKFVIPNDVVVVGVYAFNSSNLTEINIPNSVSKIGKGAFQGCKYLKNIIIPQNVTVIEDALFLLCYNLEEVTFLGKVEEIKFEEWPQRIFTSKPTVYGYEGTALEEYVKEIGLNFLPLEMKQDNIQKFSLKRNVNLNTYENYKTYNNTVKGSDYVFVVVKDPDADALLSNENLIYIDQKTAECDVIEFSYCSDLEGTELVFGLCKHNMDVTVENASCDADGVIIFKCTYCNEEEVEFISALDHDKIYCDAKVPTCTEKGWNEYITCSRCDFTTYIEIPSTGHSWQNATCTTAKTCITCGATEGEALTHTDKNGDYKCDYGCGYEFEKPVEPTTQPTTQVPDVTEPTNPSIEVTTVPSTESTTKPTVEDTTKPSGGDTTELTTQSPATTEPTTKPTETTTKPTTVVPVEPTTKPAESTTKPSSGTTTTQAPATTIPSTVVTVPSTEPTTKPSVESTTLPSTETTTKPSDEPTTIHKHTEVVVKGMATTCTENGLTDGKKCSECGEMLVDQNVIPATGHKEVTIKAVAATYKKSGKTEGKKCSVCGTITAAQRKVARKKLKKVISLKKKAVTLKKSSKSTLTLSWKKVTGAEKYEVYRYVNKKWKKIGTTKKTTLTVKKLKANKSYKFKLRAVAGTNKGSFSKVLTAKTTPLKTTLKVKGGKKQLTASWKKVANITGYEVQYSTSKKFTKKTTKTSKITKAKTTKKTIKSLKKGKKYYVRVRTYKVVDGKKIYSAWSSVKSVKVK